MPLRWNSWGIMLSAFLARSYSTTPGATYSRVIESLSPLILMTPVERQAASLDGSWTRRRIMLNALNSRMDWT